MKRIKMLMYCIALMHVGFVYGGPGDLDGNFGTGGKVTTAIGAGNDYGYDVAVQDDGKIVLVGSSYGSSYNLFATVRYDTDGSLDTDFGISGSKTTDIGGINQGAYAVAIDGNDNIVVTGFSENPAGYRDFATVRYNSDGSLDTDFGISGSVTTAIIGDGSDIATDVAIDSNGNIVVVGASNNRFAVVRYDTTGTLDADFAISGSIVTPVGSGTSFAEAVALNSDDSIVVAGWASNGSNYDFAVVKYDSDGNLDTTFGTDGVVMTGIGSGSDLGYAIAIQSDGKIVVGGASNNGSHNDFALVRYEADGSLDTTFGTNGKVTTAVSSGSNSIRGVSVDSNGKIIAVGSAYNGSTYDFAAVRYTTNGSLDTTFGTSGKVITAIGSSGGCVRSTAIQSDGKIVVAGYAILSNNDFAVVRYSGGVTTAGASMFTAALIAKYAS